MIDDLRTSGERAIHLTMKMNFTSSKDSNEKLVSVTNEDIMNSFDEEEVIEELFHSLLQRYQIGVEQSMKGSEFVFDYVNG